MMEIIKDDHLGGLSGAWDSWKWTVRKEEEPWV